MKKLISLTLALMLVFSLATVAMADDVQPTVPNISTKNNQDLSNYIDRKTTFTKEYTVNNGTAPAESFTFTVDNDHVTYVDNEGKSATTPTNKPTVTLSPAAFTTALTKAAEGQKHTATADVSIGGIDSCPLGVYTYKITENAGTTAGVNYEAKPLYLKVTILRDENNGKHYVAAVHYESEGGNKVGSTVNSYDAGSLKITKLITGNMADMNKKFTFTVKFSRNDGRVFNSIQISGGDRRTVNDDGTITITKDLGNTEFLEITNIPAGTTYVISEQNGDYTYSTNSDNTADGTIRANDTDEITYTNELSKEVDTGITLDSLPFVLILAVCAGAVVLFVIKRRNSVEF